MHVKTKIKILEEILKKQSQNSAQDLVKNWPELSDILIKKHIKNKIKNF